MNKLPNKLVKTQIFVLVFLSLFFSFSLGMLSSSVLAQDSTHSLRPFPAEPYSDEGADMALFCGNNLILAESITVTRDEARSCITLSDGNERCKFLTGKVNKTVRIDLSDAKLPILGNTENVVNSDKKMMILCLMMQGKQMNI